MKTLIILLFLLFAQTEQFIHKIEAKVLFSETELAVDFRTREPLLQKKEKVCVVVTGMGSHYQIEKTISIDQFFRIIIPISDKLPSGQYLVEIIYQDYTYSEKVTL